MEILPGIITWLVIAFVISRGLACIVYGLFGNRNRNQNPEPEFSHTSTSSVTIQQPVKQRIEIPHTSNPYYSRKTAESGSASGSAVGSLAAGSAIVALLWWFIGNVAWDALKGGF